LLDEKGSLMKSEELAGYDPREAVSFWKRMAASSNGKKPPEFMSTHPSDERRIAQLESWLPEAMEYYNGTKK
jgi:predicted Zn-dependent protease